jgi:hypothetical protein
VTGGFAHERYKYSDIGYTGTAYIVGNTSPGSIAYSTGQFAFQPYRANIYYVVGTFRF